MRAFAIIVFLLLSVANCFAQRTVKYNVYLRSDVGTDTMYDGRIIRVFGITNKLSAPPHIPAPTLYCTEGDTLVLHALSISQSDNHTVHLHGLDATTPNDGDPATSFWLTHQQDTDYTVVASHAGTYLYHCHVADVIHVQMGMYGLIVVRSRSDTNTAWTDGPKFNMSYNWLFSEVDPIWHDSIPVHNHQTDTVHIPRYNPKYFLINGKTETQIPTDGQIRISASTGSTVYLRVGSIGFFYQRIIFPDWLRVRKIDSDGRPLDVSIESDTVEIAPGERYGLLIDAIHDGNGKIAVEYINMNSDSVWNTQNIDVGFLSGGVESENSKTNDLLVYPNPAGDAVTISLKGEDGITATIEFYDLLGKNVLQSSAILPSHIDLHLLPMGLYRVIIRAKNKNYLGSIIIR
jgi:hypothetical protein